MSTDDVASSMIRIFEFLRIALPRQISCLCPPLKFSPSIIVCCFVFHCFCFWRLFLKLFKNKKTLSLSSLFQISNFFEVNKRKDEKDKMKKYFQKFEIRVFLPMTKQILSLSPFQVIPTLLHHCVLWMGPNCTEHSLFSFPPIIYESQNELNMVIIQSLFLCLSLSIHLSQISNWIISNFSYFWLVMKMGK